MVENVILENNLSAWENRYPGSRVEIEKKYNEWKIKKNTKIFVDTISSEDGKPVLLVKKDEKIKYLGGKRNSMEPVEIWLQTLGNIEEASIFFLGGMGNVLYLEQLLKKQKGKRFNIVVYEPSMEIFFTLLESVDLAQFLTEEASCVFVIDGISGVQIDKIIASMISLEMMEHVRTFILPNYNRLFPKEMLAFAKKIREQCDGCAMAINTRVRFSSVFAKNVFANAHFLLDGYKTKQLTEVIPRDIPAIIVAAGPSLNHNIDELKAAKGKAFIIAVDTAIKPLLARGIVPDMFAIVDGKKPLELVQKEQARTIPLLTSVSAANEVLTYHTGKKFFYNEGYEYINEMYYMNQCSFESLACGGSVATSAFALAFMIGLDRIILVGQDLALTGNKTHADGTFREKMEEVDTSRSLMVPGNVEEKVPTRTDFKLYLDWYNQYIKESKEYRKNFHVINATEGGAKIENTEVMSLKEAIARECTKKVDIQDCLNRLKPVLDGEQRQKALDYLHKTPEHYRQMKKNAVETGNLYKKLQKLCATQNLDLRAYEKILKKIKKMTQKIEGDALYYEPIQESLVLANYIIQSEQYETKKTVEEEGKEIARQGIIYTDMVRQCAELFEEYTKETVGKAE